MRSLDEIAPKLDVNAAHDRDPTAWVLNLDAEEELAAGRRYQPTRQLAAIVARQARRLVDEASALASFVRPGDLIVDEHTAPGAARGLRGRAWCPTPRAVALLERAGATIDAGPTLDVLRTVNARDFTARLRPQLRGEDFAKTVVHDLDAALEHLARPAPLGWLVRRTFGAAGRGRMRLGARPVEHELKWLTASLAKGPVVIEPWVDVVQEITVSGAVDARGAVTVTAPCFQAVDGAGAWNATVRAGAGEVARDHDALLLDACQRVGDALAAAHYAGPFGIDAFRYRSEPGAAVRLNALSEINARLTMDWGVAFQGSATDAR